MKNKTLREELVARISAGYRYWSEKELPNIEKSGTVNLLVDDIMEALKQREAEVVSGIGVRNKSWIKGQSQSKEWKSGYSAAKNDLQESKNQLLNP